MSRYFTLTAILLLANFVPAADAQLEPLYSSNPALTGFLGSPGVGGFIEGKVVWHRSGGVFGLDQNRQAINPLNQWRMDPQTLRATRTAVYNVGDVWALSRLSIELFRTCKCKVNARMIANGKSNHNMPVHVWL